MRPLLVLIAAASISGCSCYDAAYEDFCRQTGKCDGGSGGGSGGAGGGSGGGSQSEPNYITLDIPTAQAGDCKLVKVELRDSNGLPASFSGPSTISLSSSQAGVHFYNFCSAGKTEIVSVDVPAGNAAATVGVSFDNFGSAFLDAAFMNVTGRQGVMVTAGLTFEHPSAVITNDGGCTRLRVVARSPLTTPPNADLTANESVDFTLSSSSSALAYGTSAGSCATVMTSIPVTFVQGSNDALIFVTSSAGAGVTDRLTITAGADGGLTGEASIVVAPVCLSASHPCSSGADCCSAACSSGTCD